MATLRVHHRDAARDVALPACAIVGRAAACAVRIDDPFVPMHWLEIRWSTRGWRWRALSGETRTRGVGGLSDDGWRLLPDSPAARPQRVRFGDTLSIELTAGGPPEPFLMDLQTGETLTGEAMDAVVEPRDDRLLRVALDDTAAAPLRDGDVVVHEGRAWRVHLAEAPLPTAHVRIDLARGNATLEVVDADFRAVVHQSGAEAAIAGEHVRALAVYARARATDTPRGGWLSVQGAWEAWVAAGGNPQSPVERLAWDRARCRTHLARQGVGGLEQLFETRRIGGAPHYRLGIDVE